MWKHFKFWYILIKLNQTFFKIQHRDNLFSRAEVSLALRLLPMKFLSFLQQKMLCLKIFGLSTERLKNQKDQKINIEQISNLIIQEKLYTALAYVPIWSSFFKGNILANPCSSWWCQHYLRYWLELSKSLFIICGLYPHLASWQEARKAIHSSNLLLVSSWEKREKIGRKNPRNQVFFCHQICTDNLGGFNSTQGFPRESKFKVKITNKAIKFEFS